MEYINDIKDYFYNLFYKEEEIEYKYEYQRTNRKKYSPVKKSKVVFKNKLNNVPVVESYETDAKILDLQFRLIELSRNNHCAKIDDDDDEDKNNYLKEEKTKKLIKN